MEGESLKVKGESMPPRREAYDRGKHFGCPAATRCFDCEHYESETNSRYSIKSRIPHGKCKKRGGFTYPAWYGWVNINRPDDWDLEKELEKLNSK